MIARRLLSALFGGLALALALLTVLNTSSWQPAHAAPTSAVRYVQDIDGVDGSDCTSSLTPCRTVQYAMSVAGSGDTIRVANKYAPAIYTGTVHITKTVILEGGWATAGHPSGLLWQRPTPCESFRTILDAEGNGRAVHIAGNVAPVIDCFTITGGDATGLGGDPASPTANDAGGGIYSANAAPIIINNVITGNIGCMTCQAAYGRGGGIYLLNSPATAVISNNVIANNTAAVSTIGQGGGIYLRDLAAPLTVSGNRLEGNIGGFNQSGSGGGIHVDHSSVTIDKNRFIDNAATWAGNSGAGGGVYATGGSVLLSTNVITGNAGAFFPGFPSTAIGGGGGVAISGTTATLQDNQITKNVATNGENAGWGGGIYAYSSTLQIVDNTVADNDAVSIVIEAGFGGGVYVIQSPAPLLTGNTIRDNTATQAGGGIYLVNSDDATVNDNIVTGNTGGWGGGIYVVDSDETALTENTVVGNAAQYGGGLYLFGDGCCTWSFMLENNVVAENQSSTSVPGVYVKGISAHLLHTTLARNTGGDGIGVYVTSGEATLTNTILVSQTTGVYVSGDSTATLTATLWGSGAWDNGADSAGSGAFTASAPNLYQAPVFVNPTTGDYHLRGSSPGLDQGVSAGVAIDIDGEPRTYGAGPDLGADEVSCLARVPSGAVYPLIQSAVDAATSGQTVQVAAGTCYENVVVTKTVTLEGGWDTAFSTRSADPPSVTTLHGSQTGRVISITEVSGSIAPTIDGFTITGGDATGLDGSGMGYDVGGGIYSWYATTTISNCVIRKNVASRSTIGWGGGVGVYGDSVTLQNSTVEENVASTTSSGYGGGVFVRSATSVISGNEIADNIGSMVGHGYGGGISFIGGIATLQGNTIVENTASLDLEGYGGGLSIYLTTASLDGDDIGENIGSESGSGYGGGIACRESGTLTADNVAVYSGTATFGGGIYLNECTGSSVDGSRVTGNNGGMGGGFYVSASPAVTVTGSYVAGNTAEYGGGLLFSGSDGVTLEGNTIQDNTADGMGGGIWLTGCDDASLTNNFVTDNQLASSSDGAGLMVHMASARLRHTTLADNDGGNGQGVYLSSSSTVWMTNTILVGHAVGIGVSGDSTATLQATLWGSGLWDNGADWAGSGTIVTGTPNLFQAPAFVNPAAGNYHLFGNSPGVDQGVATGVTTDVDGDPRTIGPAPDLGADEAWPPVFLPLVMRNS